MRKVFIAENLSFVQKRLHSDFLPFLFFWKISEKNNLIKNPLFVWLWILFSVNKIFIQNVSQCFNILEMIE